ncbi:hypothetical protein BH18ACT15_BH18ACT15_08600 [soil metagenome]
MTVMTQTIDLLPGRYAARRHQRQTVGVIAIAGLAVLILLILFWFYLGSQIATAEGELEAAQATNTKLQTDVNRLQRFGALETSVTSKAADVATVMANDVDWPSVLTEIGMVVPSNVQLTTVSASAGTVEGAAPVATETATVRVAKDAPYGRVSFQGSTLDMNDVSQWLVRLGAVPGFQAAYLNDASKAADPAATTTTGTAGPDLVTFDTSVEMTEKTAATRFQPPQGAE